MSLFFHISLLVLIASTNLFSQTVLINAIRKSKTTVVIELINNGADVNEYLAHKENHNHTGNCLGHDYNRSPLFWAVLRSDYQIINLLIKKGANINFKNARGKTALHIAIQKYNIKSVKILLKAKAQINSQDEYGNTAILIATYNYEIETNKKVKEKIREIIITLLNNNADVNLENKQNKKPTDFKIINELLKNHKL